MIIQGLMDFLSSWVAGILGLLPALPSQWVQSLDWATDGAAFLGGKLALLGPIFPWAVFATIVAAWSGALAFWLAMVGLRLGLWLIGR